MLGGQVKYFVGELVSPGQRYIYKVESVHGPS